jgi:hypothetical protein
MYAGCRLAYIGSIGIAHLKECAIFLYNYSKQFLSDVDRLLYLENDDYLFTTTRYNPIKCYGLSFRKVPY